MSLDHVFDVIPEDQFLGGGGRIEECHGQYVLGSVLRHQKPGKSEGHPSGRALVPSSALALQPAVRVAPLS